MYGFFLPEPVSETAISVSSCRRRLQSPTAVTASSHWRPRPSNSAGTPDCHPIPIPRVARHRRALVHRVRSSLGRARRRRGSVRQRAIVRVDARCLVGPTTFRHGHRRHRVCGASTSMSTTPLTVDIHESISHEGLRHDVPTLRSQYAVVHPELADIVGIYGTIITAHEAPWIAQSNACTL